MTRRLMFAVFASALVLTLQGLAHEGHDHKVLGTVTMAAPDHVMLTDTKGKDVTVYLTKDTKVLRDKKPAKVEDIRNGLRVVITARTVKENNVEKLMAKLIEIGTAPATK